MLTVELIGPISEWQYTLTNCKVTLTMRKETLWQIEILAQICGNAKRHALTTSLVFLLLSSM